MKAQRVMLISGFLGSGKTTTMVSMAEYMRANGKVCALITNDLGSNLVDTNFVASHHVPVVEISDGCLCHDVPQTVASFKILSKENPNLIIFEPVGCCVDMVRQVYADLQKNYAGQYELVPVTAVVDPIRYRAIVMKEGENTLPEESAYMFERQLAEAEVFLLNKTDLLTEKEIESILKSLNENYPSVPVVPVCAKDGVGFDKWAELILNGQQSKLKSLEMNWDLVYVGAKKMGWYNCTNKITGIAGKAVDMNGFVRDLMAQIKIELEKQTIEAVHLKTIAKAGDEFVKAALTSLNNEVFVSHVMTEKATEAMLVVNIRAVAPPEMLSAIISETLNLVMEDHAIQLEEGVFQSFTSMDEAPVPTKM